ncbi:hypothetical protein MFRU_002g03550 [Monilinia fructicola]|uniref:DUF7918 domain-containing protein n=1 Tax=Monilinia fructicola TaxID=38448 RepID=A0A5M9K2J8_MONFR|nr:hypothetical protein EYC84_004235 [Monilinia fructicola]KAG4035006.1 hypothetical protein MFRU_002g03550 [Monilinia fructicola]
MAVLKSVRGIQVTVRVDGKALEEYEDDEFEAVPGEVGDYQASRTVAKYIESCTGKNFDMKFKVDEEYKFDSPNITFSTYVDGTKVHTRIVARNNSFPREKTLKGVNIESKNGLVFLKPFHFSNIITSVDDSKLASMKEDTERLSAAGEIIVKVYRRSAKRPSRGSSLSHRKINVDTLIDVHEKALKGRAISHSTGLGAPQPAKAHDRHRFGYLDGKDYPIAIFRFKYRSKKSLQSLLIIERTPEPPLSPSPSIADEAKGSFDLENLNEAQKVKLQEFLGNLIKGSGNPEDENKKIKQEGETKIKRERQQDNDGFNANKRSKKGKRVEIDLTGGDSA